MRLDLLYCHLVVAAHVQLFAKLAQILNEVVSERVVVVYNKYDGSPSPYRVIVAGAYPLSKDARGPSSRRYGFRWCLMKAIVMTRAVIMNTRAAI
jgi:hypothetical protein